ncbi:aminotransferase class I/II-fold pyridoxal phosphate-dependent enzyme [Nakamurella sp. YIM 132087]|uniref:cysteine-S-conjugate beta-lyase n=1 Tax=Nakamurella alba TaxID=2665158 RepID=A0A7K1FUY6_9ACTN|nr:aminotransferase class I/II-fold pyridoxal phosphate-dependent enzyme [Nakamurella alba]MTD17013.1 aminotransferase class I/II-fold pyridoxal phosphate-dependent enzyme [Nakamurella alba]
MTTVSGPADVRTARAGTVAELRGRGSLKWTQFPGALGAWVAESDFGTAPAVAQALRTAIEQDLFGYLPESARSSLVQACAGWMRSRYGWEVDHDRIVLVPDALKGMEVAIEHFSAPGSPVIVTPPAYPPFYTLPRSLGREVVEVPMIGGPGTYRLDLDGIDRAFAAGAGMLMLCNPHNPLGVTSAADELAALSSIVARHGARVCSDEVHAPLLFSGSIHVPYASVDGVAAAHTVTVTSTSKAWNLAGTKCAQLILGGAADLEIWDRVGFMPSHGASTLGVIASTAAYSAGGAWLADTMVRLEHNRDRLYELLPALLPGITSSRPQATYLAWLDCSALGLGEPAAEFFLREAGVALTDGRPCGSDIGDDFVRLNFAMPADVLEQAVEQMAEAVRRLSASS